MRGLTSPIVRVAEYDGFERSPMKNIQNETLKELEIAEKASKEIVSPRYHYRLSVSGHSSLVPRHYSKDGDNKLAKSGRPYGSARKQYQPQITYVSDIARSLARARRRRHHQLKDRELTKH
jgi:hypothetical protein